jgi:hypothetical protein
MASTIARYKQSQIAFNPIPNTLTDCELSRDPSLQRASDKSEHGSSISGGTLEKQKLLDLKHQCWTYPHKLIAHSRLARMQ